MNIYEALEQAAALREQADELRRQADELEVEWVGAASGDVLTVQRLVDVVRKDRPNDLLALRPRRPRLLVQRRHRERLHPLRREPMPLVVRRIPCVRLGSHDQRAGGHRREVGRVMLGPLRKFSPASREPLAGVRLRSDVDAEILSENLAVHHIEQAIDEYVPPKCEFCTAPAMDECSLCDRAMCEDDSIAEGICIECDAELRP